MLIIFDLDGTLVKLDDLQFAAYDATLAYFDIDYDLRHMGLGSSIYKKMDKLKSLGYDFDTSEFKVYRDQWVANNVGYYLEYSSELFSEISRLATHHVLCIATNAGRPYTLSVCDILKITPFIKVINTIDEFKPKPAPDMFINCIEKYTMDAIIFEDSDTGISAALQTNAQLIQVTSPSDTIHSLKSL